MPRLLNDTLELLREMQNKGRRDELLEKSRDEGGLDSDEKSELRLLLDDLAEKKARLEAD